jgi:HEXXH motif-containing protein
LTLPAPGDRAAAQLQRKLRLLVLRTLLTHPLDEHGGALERSLALLRPILMRVLKQAPQALLDAMSPDVLAPLLALASGMLSVARACGAAVPALLAGLYTRRAAGALPEAIFWEGECDRILDDAGRRAFVFAAPVRALFVHAAGFEVELATGRRLALGDGSDDAAWQRVTPFHAIAPRHSRLVLAELDSNPLAHVEAHPEKRGNAIDLGGRKPGEWTRALSGALELIDTALPSWSAELTEVLVRVVPVGFAPERHLSASYREAPGIAYLTLHPDPLTLAEAIVHETQHNKLNALTWFDPLLENGHSEWTQSPVRPDPRPLMGVLLAAHAFVPVAALRLRLQQLEHPLARGQSRRLAQVVAANQRALGVVRERGKPTALGRRVIDELERLHLAIRAAAPNAPGDVAPGDDLPE